uniref:Uncharacterized protein n=1 Tax=Glycine max TaxID=3847 RepID=C6TLU0_SOYBN|nr:unknown [Glycine max]
MDKESHNNGNSVRERDKVGGGGDNSSGAGSLLLRGGSDGMRQATTSDLGLQWGNRKRLRCMKVQVKHDSFSSNNPVQRTTTTTVRVDRRVVRTEKDSSSNIISRPLPTINNISNNITNNNFHNNNNQSNNGYLNLRQRPPSPQQPPPRILRYFCLHLPSTFFILTFICLFIYADIS